MGTSRPKGYDFGPLWTENGYRLCQSDMVFERTTVAYERIFRFNSKERKRNMRIRNGFEEFFCFGSNLSNDDIISA